MAKRGRKRRLLNDSRKETLKKVVKLDDDTTKDEHDESEIIYLDTQPRPSSSAFHQNGGVHIPPHLGNNEYTYEKKLIGVTYSGDVSQTFLIKQARKKFKEQCDELDRAIWMHYKHNGQNSEVYRWKMEVRDKLLEEFRNLFYECKNLNLWAVGSTVNGCGSFNSDMDLCLCLPDEKADNPYFTERSKCIRVLRKVQTCLNKRPNMRTLVRHTEVITAKVPIIKVDLHPPYKELDLDINVNNVAGVYNSHLIHYYSRIDVRFPALCLLIKHWAIRNEISDAMTGTFNSYSLILLVLHYLQCGVAPAVLPNLQYLMPNLFSTTVPLEHLELFCELEGIPKRPPNNMSVGDLLMGFFHYYHAFDFNTWAISVRSGKKFPRTELDPDDSRYYIFIEEPFDLINTARCVTKDHCFRAIKKAFSDAHNVFEKHPDLRDIGIQF